MFYRIMISKESNIINLLNTIQNYKNSNREKLFYNYVCDRLNKSLEHYKKRIDYEAYYLKYKDDLRLLRNINTLRKKNDL